MCSAIWGARTLIVNRLGSRIEVEARVRRAEMHAQQARP
jgi:hypothetical protein